MVLFSVLSISNYNERNNDINNNDFSVVNEKVENSNVKYEPTLKKKKKPSDGLEISKEVKAMMKIIKAFSIVQSC